MVIIPTTITIPSRFCGPPGSANGGYAAGLLARSWPDPKPVPAVCVTIRQPLPLDRPIGVVAEVDRIELRDGDAVLAEARSDGLDERPPRTVTIADARAAGDRCAVLVHPDWHPVPGCFVCGTNRAAGDGLRLFAGALVDGIVATTWTPDASVADADNGVPTEVVWAALDCPSSMHIYRHGVRPDTMYVLGRITGRVDEHPTVGEEYVIVSWELAREGRKLLAACALQRADGSILATTRATWIRL